MTYNLATALMQRVCVAVHFAIERGTNYLNDANSPWWAFSLSEASGASEGSPLQYDILTDSVIEFTRKNHPGAKIRLENLQLASIGNMDWGTPVSVSSNVIERYLEPIHVDPGATYNSTINHTFSKTTSLLEAATVGAKLAIEASVGYSAGTAGGVQGGVKATAEITASYERTWGSTETTTDTVTRDVHLAGPWIGQYQAVRSTDKISRTISVEPKFEFQIILYSGDTELGRWASFDQLLNVVHGDAPSDRYLGKELRENPVADPEYRFIQRLAQRKFDPIRWEAIFDSVATQRIDIIRDDQATNELKRIEEEHQQALKEAEEKRQAKIDKVEAAGDDRVKQIIAEHDAEKKRKRQEKAAERRRKRREKKEAENAGKKA